MVTMTDDGRMFGGDGKIMDGRCMMMDDDTDDVRMLVDDG
jgi:hypothetical protein